MSDDEDAHTVLRVYPQIYLACHREHRTRSSSPDGMTSREATLLAHVADPAGIEPTILARHLGIGKPALSAALSRLSALGFVVVAPNESDRRRRLVRLTPSGREMIAQNSVLNIDRVRAMLDALAPERRRAAVRGLIELAAAASSLRNEDSREDDA